MSNLDKLTIDKIDNINNQEEPLDKSGSITRIKEVYKGKAFITARRKDDRKRKLRLVFFSFLLPILAFIPAFIVSGVFPFGGDTTLAVDLRHEYVGFYEGFRNALTSSGGFFYNMYKSIGGEMVGTFAYYMMSPWNLLFFVFPREAMPIVIQATQMLKIGLAGASFSLLLLYNEHGKDWKVVLFSTMYGLLSFSTANLLNHMWLDPIAIFPLVILGLERLIDGKNPLLYVFTLTYMIWTNFYIGYMGCIMVVLYFIYAIVRRSASRDQLKWTGFFRPLSRFALYSLLAGAICAVLLLPTLYSLVLSKVSYASTVVANWEFDYPPLDFFTKMLPGAFNYDQVPSGLPNVFTGTITNIFLIAYLLNGRISFRERFVSLLILAFLFLSMNIDKLNVFWHGMQYPIWYEYRFSWVFSFFIALLAFRSFMRFEKANILKFIIVVLLYGALYAYLYLHLEDYDFLMIYHLVGGAIIFVALMAMILIYPHKRKVAAILLLLISFAEMSLNASVHTVVYNYESMEEFQFFDRVMHEALDGVRPDEEDEFWRIEKTFMHDNNDGMRFHYPTTTHFNSALERKTIDLFSAMGFAVSNNSLNGTNPTKFTDAMFGIRYYMRGLKSAQEEDIQGIDKLKDKSNRPDLVDMDLIRETNYVQIFENNNYLPLGLLAEADIENLKSARANPLDFQDRIMNTLDNTDEENNYYVRLAVKHSRIENLDIKPQGKNRTNYTRIEPEMEAYLDYSFYLMEGNSHYLTVSNTLDRNNSKLYLNSVELANKRMGRHNSSQVYNVSNSKDANAENHLKVELLKDKSGFDINNISLFYLDEELFQDLIAFQQKHGLELDYFSDTHIRGTFTATENTPYLLITLPHDQGWHAKVDGKAVETVEVLDALIAIPVSEGHHELELSYELPYFKLGAIISIGALIALFFILIFRGINNRRRRKKSKPAEQKVWTRKELRRSIVSKEGNQSSSTMSLIKETPDVESKDKTDGNEESLIPEEADNIVQDASSNHMDITEDKNIIIDGVDDETKND